MDKGVAFRKGGKRKECARKERVGHSRRRVGMGGWGRDKQGALVWGN